MDIHKNARLTVPRSRADRAPGDERADAAGRRISRRRLPADHPQMAADTGVRSVPVVAVKPSGQLGCAFVRGVIGTGIGPLAQARLDEALSLAVSFGRVRLGSDVFEGELLAGFGEVPREIARAVVGHNTLDLDPQTCVIGHRRFEEGNGAGRPLVAHDPAEGDTRCVVDADMDELPADAEMAVDHAGLSSRDPMAYRADPAELLDIDVDELTRLFPLVTADGLRLQSAQLVQAQTTQNAADGGRRDADLGRDLPARPALAPQLLDLCDVGRRSRCGRELRSCRPARPSARYRDSHLRMVRGQTPAANATACGVCPLITWRTIRSRP